MPVKMLDEAILSKNGQTGTRTITRYAMFQLANLTRSKLIVTFAQSLCDAILGFHTTHMSRNQHFSKHFSNLLYSNPKAFAKRFGLQQSGLRSIALHERLKYRLVPSSYALTMVSIRSDEVKKRILEVASKLHYARTGSSSLITRRSHVYRSSFQPASSRV